MRILSSRLGSCLILLFVAGLVTTTQTAARPPSQTAHGINSSTFHTLWAGDVDTETGPVTTTDIPMQELAGMTDIPLGSPPKAVAQWNHGDHTEFPETTAQTSIYPAAVQLADGQYIRDAYVTAFAINPSTRIFQSPTAHSRYIAPAGTVLGVVDYRIALPVDDEDDSRDVTWRLLDHQIVETRLLVDSAVVARADGTHTPSLSFHGISAASGEPRTLVLESTIRASLEKQETITERYCEPATTTTTETTTNNETQTETTTTTSVTAECWETTDVVTSYPTEEVVVREEHTVRPYDPTITGYRADYPTGEQGVVFSHTQPVRAYSSAAGSIRTNWWFFSARDARWDQLTVSNATNRRIQPSPLVPLQINAFPSELKHRASANITLLDVVGESSDPPVLPQHVHMDVATTPYIVSEGVVVQYETLPSLINVRGLVRGVETTLQSAELTTIPIHRSNLSVSVVNTTADEVTVTVTLEDATTGAPIDTGSRGGEIILASTPIETTETGTVTTTIPRPMYELTARYEPAPWWQHDRGYLGDTDVVVVEGGSLSLLSTTFALTVWILLFLLAVFLIDRLTGWHSWPPWRGL